MTDPAAKSEIDSRTIALDELLRQWARWGREHQSDQVSILWRIEHQGPVGASIRGYPDGDMPKDVSRVERAVMALRTEERMVVMARFLTMGKERDKARDCEISYSTWRLRMDKAYAELIGRLGL